MKETEIDSPKEKFSRAEIIRTVQTPLGFFSLVVLVVEALFGIIAGFSQGTDRTYLIIGMLGLIFLLIVIVAILAIWRPESLQGKRPKLNNPSGVQVISDITHIKNPKILCAATPMFEELGFEKDIEILQRFFKKPHLAHNITFPDLRNLLMQSTFDIVHLLGFVDPEDGSFVFNSSDERLSSEGFANLLNVCKTHLVVLASCDSISLAASVSRKVNIIAATKTIKVDTFTQWADSFYNLISQGHPLSRAFDVATTTTNAPMVLLMNHDITFSA